MAFFEDLPAAIGETPLVTLNHISPNPEVKLFAKLEGMNAGGSASMKDRIVSYMLRKARADGSLKPGMTILEATSGNTGIALACLGRYWGFPVKLVMPAVMSVERRRVIQLFGAELLLTEGGMKEAINTAYEMAASDDSYFMPDQFKNFANPQSHYETTAVEILRDFPETTIDALVVGVGTAGTITGVSRRLREHFPDVRVYGVEPYIGDAIQGLKCMEYMDELPPYVDLSLITERTFCRSAEANAAARRLLEKESIFAGQSSGAVVHRVLELARDMERGNIVMVLPDGGWKYLSLDIWDV
jgi:[CysO sulfur-carrier protein]-thiocarboxylate-dependent cysteine synthase